MIIKLILEGIIILGIFVAFFSLGVLVGNGTIDSYFSPKTDNKIINSTNEFNSTNELNLKFGKSMNEAEIEKVKILINFLDPIYIAYNKEILFVKSTEGMNPEDSEYCKKAYNGSGCGGFNDDGNISMLWKEINKNNEYVLCHELLHDFIPIKSNSATKIEGRWVYDDPMHTAIDDLARKGVCYKSKW